MVPAHGWGHETPDVVSRTMDPCFGPMSRVGLTVLSLFPAQQRAHNGPCVHVYCMCDSTGKGSQGSERLSDVSRVTQQVARPAGNFDFVSVLFP